jgi:hypothetical protein
VKKAAKPSRHKKVVALLLNRTSVTGYVDPTGVGKSPVVDILTTQGEHRAINLEDIKSLYFVRDFEAPFEPEQKRFLSRPKLDGLWVRLRFRDEDVVEGMVSNNLLNLLDAGVQLTPPDLHGNTTRMFIPRSALLEMKVLGVVGVARRATKDSVAAGGTAASQTNLFGE